MNPQPKEIYHVRLPYRHSNDIRPAIVIEHPSGGQVAVVPLSSQMDLYEGPGMHFRIDPTHPDFAATGLNKECFANGHEIVVVKVDDLQRKRGILQGQLAKDFDRWI